MGSSCFWSAVPVAAMPFQCISQTTAMHRDEADFALTCLAAKHLCTPKREPCSTIVTSKARHLRETTEGNRCCACVLPLTAGGNSFTSRRKMRTEGEMLRIQNRHVDWDRHQIAIPGQNAKDGENRRIPFDPHGRLTPILKRRSALGPNAYVFGTPSGEFQQSFKTAWEALLLVANRHETKRIKPGSWTDRDRAKLRQIDLHWHDLRHEGACRLLADGVDIRTIQQTQRYLNITDEELRKSMTGVWERRRQLRAVSQ